MFHDAAIEETYTYSGLGGRVSQRDTKLRFDNVLGESFVQTFSWTQLGLPDTVGYPTCATGFTSCTPALPSRTAKFGYSQGLLNTVGLVNNGTAYATSIGYHDNGMVNTVAHSNGVIDTQTLDPSKMARPLAISAALGGTTLWSSGNYAYDGAGNVTRTGGGYYFYDGVSRLKEGKVFLGPEGAAGGFKIQRPTYDAFGNIQTLSLQTGNAAPVPRDEVATTSSTNRLTAGTYDAAGNLTAASGQTFEYDAFNQARRITMAGQDWLHFYTADDERVWSYKLGGNPFNRWTLRDLSGKVLREAISENAGWRVERDYIYRDSSLLASDAPTPLSTRHFHLDHLGTPRAISDVNGARVAYHLYLPFGEEATEIDQDAERKKFTGHERDAHSEVDSLDDLDYMMARHHSPVTGRFLSFDPVGGSTGSPQSWNRYAYVLGNPLKYIDPLGLQAEPNYGVGYGITVRPNDSSTIFMSDLTAADWLLLGIIQHRALLNAAAGDSPRETLARGVGQQVVVRTQWVVSGAEGAARLFDGLTGYVSAVDGLVAGDPSEAGVALALALIPGPFDNVAASVRLTGFTKHGINSAISHDGVGVASRAILDAVRSPVRVEAQSGGRLMVEGRQAVVVINHLGKVITTWAKSAAAWRIR